MTKHIILVGALFLGSMVNAQVNTHTNVNPAINGENPFLDASGYIRSVNNIGKGLYFPKTDLTTWEFKTSGINPGKFSTYFDGMIVYNSGTGNTIADATKGGKQVAVTPGFYYFKNPNQSAPRGSVANGEWVRLGADASAFDGEWVYDDTTKRINLKRSGSGEFKNKVFYDSQTGQLVNIDDEKNIRYPELVSTGSSVNIVEKVKSLDETEKYRNFTYTETKNLPLSIATNHDGSKSNYKRMSTVNMVVSSGENAPYIQGDSNRIFVPSDNRSNFTSFYNGDRLTDLFGNGNISLGTALSAATRIGNGQNITNFATGTLSTVGILGTGTINLARGTFNRIQYQSAQGGVVNQSAAGFFGTESEEFDNTLIKNYHGIQVRSFNNSKNTGEGVYMAGIYNEITQNSNTAYTDMYGIYTKTFLGPNAKAPKNLYGIYIDNVNGGETSNYAIYTKAGQMRVGDLADASATADRTVVVDKDGVLKVGTASGTTATKVGTTTGVECKEDNRGTMNFGRITINGKATDAIGFCMKNGDNEFRWYYIYGGAAHTVGTSAVFGSGL